MEAVGADQAHLATEKRNENYTPLKLLKLVTITRDYPTIFTIIF